MLPRVIIHMALSLDGRIDWFAPDVGLFYELAGHWNEDATLAGSETMLNAPDEIPGEDEEAFEPVKIAPNDTRPILVVPDSQGRLRSWHYWKKQPYWKNMVALCSDSTPEEYLEYLDKRHINSIVSGADKVNLSEALEKLNSKFGVQTVRVDSGGVLNGILLRAGLVSEVSVLFHPALVGGETPRSFFRAPDLDSSEGVLRLKLIHTQELKNGIVWLRYEVLK